MQEHKLQEKGTDTVHQQMQAAKEEDAHIKDLDHLMDLIVSQSPRKPMGSSDDNTIDNEAVKEVQFIEVSHIDLICGDNLSFSEDCDPLVQIQGLKHQFIRSRIQSRSGRQMKQRLKSTLGKRFCRVLTFEPT